jgi:methionine--tRNA ligase beta chain
MTDQPKPIVSFDDFLKLDIRVARVGKVTDHPNADKLIVLEIDLGGEQRQIIAGLKPYLDDPQSLAGKNIVVVTNLEPRKMRGLESNGMLLAATAEVGGQQKVFCLIADDDIPAGATVS